MRRILRKYRGHILACALVVLLLVFCQANLWYWRKLLYISKSYSDNESPAYHVTSRLVGQDPWTGSLPRLQHTRVPVTAQPKTNGVKILQVVSCEEKNALYCAVRYPVNLPDPLFLLRVDGELLKHCDNITIVDGFPYALQEFTLDLSQAPPLTPDNTALELYYCPVRGEKPVLLESIAK